MSPSWICGGIYRGKGNCNGKDKKRMKWRIYIFGSPTISILFVNPSTMSKSKHSFGRNTKDKHRLIYKRNQNPLMWWSSHVTQNRTYQGPTWRSKTFIYMSPCKKLGPSDIGKGWSSGIGYKKNRRSLSTFRLCSGGYWYPVNMSFCMADEQTEAGIPVMWTVQENCGEFHFASHDRKLPKFWSGKQ